MTIMNIDKYGDDLVYRPTHEGNILLTALHVNYPDLRLTL